MSEENKNSDEDRLKDLLNKSAPEDDFEKEAREGFELLGSREEAFELKAQVDRRMKEEVLKEGHHLRLWLAAAALLLLVGFSVYMIDGFGEDETKVAVSFSDRDEKIGPPPPRDLPLSPAVTVKDDRETAVQEKKKVAVQPPRTAEKTREARGDQAEGIAADQIMEDRRARDTAIRIAAAQPLPEMAEQGAAQMQMAPPNTSYSQPELLEEQRVAKKRYAARQKAPTEAPSVATPEAIVSSPALKALYPGGNDSICARVAAKMAGKPAKYDALLFIDGSGKVRKAVITDRYGLSRKEEKALEELLLKMDGFIVEPAAGGASFAEYRLKCRP